MLQVINKKGTNGEPVPFEEKDDVILSIYSHNLCNLTNVYDARNGTSRARADYALLDIVKSVNSGM